MRRIVTALATTVTVLVLLFSYHTSTSSGGLAGSAAVASAVPGAVAGHERQAGTGSLPDLQHAEAEVARDDEGAGGAERLARRPRPRGEVEHQVAAGQHRLRRITVAAPQHRTQARQQLRH